MELKFDYKNSSGKDEAFNKVKEYVTPELLLAKFKIRTTVDYDSSNLRVLAKGKGFTFQMSFLDGNATSTLNLSFFLKPMAPRISETLIKHLSTII